MDMSLKRRMLGCAFAGLLSPSLYAGTMGEPMPSFEGFLFGVGGGYLNTNLSKWTNVTMLSTFPSITEYYQADNIKSSFSPIANASYFSAFQDLWLWGIKGVYKYLGVQHPSLLWSGTYQNGTYQEATFHTELVQEFFLTLNAGYQIFPNWLVYLGVGPSITEAETELRGNLLPNTSISFQYSEQTKSKVLWGVAGQVGFEYMLPHRFMLDLSYNLVVSPKTTMPTTYFSTNTTSFYSAFTQRVRVLDQGLNVTVNKYFS